MESKKKEVLKQWNLKKGILRFLMVELPKKLIRQTEGSGINLDKDEELYHSFRAAKGILEEEYDIEVKKDITWWYEEEKVVINKKKEYYLALRNCGSYEETKNTRKPKLRDYKHYVRMS